MAQPVKIELSAVQRQELERMRKRDPKAYKRERASAVLQAAEGKSASEIARQGLLRPRYYETVVAWLKAYQAEGVAGGVEEDAERRARLVVGRRRTDGQHGLLRSIEVLHHHVEVHLLRHVLAGPLRGAVAVHPLKADALVIGFAAHLTPALVRGGGPPQQQATELGEATRVAAVDDERGEACDGHAKDRTPSSGQVPSDCRS
mgnify:CR=1 FL=1